MSKYPFSPELLDAMPEEIAELYRNLEVKLLDEICSRLNIADQLNEVTIQDIRALRSHGIDLDEIQTAIQKTAKVSEEKLDALIADVVARNQAFYGELATLADITAPEWIVGPAEVAAIRRQTWSALYNITGSMGFLVKNERGGLELLPPAKAWHWALDNAVMQVQSGGISYNQAIAGAVEELTDKGLCIEYITDKKTEAQYPAVSYEPKEPGKRGKVDHVDVAARRAVMTAVNQVCDKYTEASMNFLNTRYCEVSAHSGARDKVHDPSRPWQSHKAWQGRVYYESEAGEPDPLGKYPDLHDTTGFGEVDGLTGANCRHHRYGWVEGVSERTYTDEQLEHIDDHLGCTFEGREYSAYEATQQQRRMEVTMRKLRRQEAAYQAAGLADEAAATGAALTALRKKYRAFSEKAGLPEQWERAAVYQPKKGEDAPKMEKPKPELEKAKEKAVEKLPESAIIKVKPSGGDSMSFRTVSTDVTEEYLENATPGIGTVTYGKDYSESKHRAEINIANWLHKSFGGDIQAIDDRDFKTTSPDYIWRGKMWEHKEPSTETATDSAVRKALKQISENPGGIILDFGSNPATESILEIIRRRIERSGINLVDVIIRTDAGEVRVIRHKKEGR